jgi:hypothetical protein
MALVFPAVVIVRRLPRSDLARYMERARPRRIELSVALRAYKPDIQKRIILHEIGHWWRREHVGGAGWTRAMEESFAHAFSDGLAKGGGGSPDLPRKEIEQFASECYSRLHQEVP